MKKKILSLLMVIAITIFQFAPTMVSALSYESNFDNSEWSGTDESRNSTAYNSYNVTSNVVTLYVGNVSVDGTSQLKYLYTDKSVNTETLTEMRKILTGDYTSLLPTTAGQVKVSNDTSVTVNDVFTDAGLVAANKYPDGTVTDTSSTILYNQTQFNSLVTASQTEVSDEATAEANNLTAYNTRKATWESDSLNAEIEFPEEYVNAFNDSTTYPTTNYFIADNKTESTAGVSGSNKKYIYKNGKITEIDMYNIDRTIIKVVNTSADVTTSQEQQQKQYTINNDLATAIFTFDEGHDFVLNINDLLTMTPAQIESNYGIDEETYNSYLEIIKNNVKQYGTLISLYDITIDDGNLGYSDALTLKLKLTEAMKKYNTLKLIYLDENDNFKVADVKDLVINSATADVDLDHLSVYALVGSNTQTTTDTTTTADASSNPQTGDNILFYIGVLGLSVIGLAGAGLYTKKRRFN